MDWLAKNFVAIAAVLLSAFTLIFSQIQNSAANDTSVNLRLQVVEREVAHVELLRDRTAGLESKVAVTDNILIKLNDSVNDLNESTKQLASVATKVAVLDEKIDNMENRVEFLTRPHAN